MRKNEKEQGAYYRISKKAADEIIIHSLTNSRNGEPDLSDILENPPSTNDIINMLQQSFSDDQLQSYNLNPSTATNEDTTHLIKNLLEDYIPTLVEKLHTTIDKNAAKVLGQDSELASPPDSELSPESLQQQTNQTSQKTTNIGWI